jgi:hypothetical protein
MGASDFFSDNFCCVFYQEGWEISAYTCFSSVNLTSFANFWKTFANFFDITKLELEKTKRKKSKTLMTTHAKEHYNGVTRKVLLYYVLFSSYKSGNRH